MHKYSGAPSAGGFPELGLEPDMLARVRAGLKAVVNEPGGTGANAHLGEGKPLVAGKTGTSQTRRLGEDRSQTDIAWHERDHALFVAYVPADAPRYAVATVVEHGGGGGAVAAPIARDVITALMEMDPMRASAVEGARARRG